MSLKSGRKGKYTGGSFASRFKDSLAMKSPLNVVVAGQNEQILSDAAKAKKEMDEKATPEDEQGQKNIEKEKSREELSAFHQRVKLAEEQEAAKKAAEAAAEGEGEVEEELADVTKGEQIGFDDDYGDADTKKDIRAESKENKKQIRSQKKDSKAAAKGEKKDAKAAAKQLEGKDKRLAKKAARQEFKSDKKAIRQQKKSAKKANRKAKKRAKKGRK